MRAAVLVIDMVRDTFREEESYPITPHARAIIPRINEINRWARKKGFPVVFACDSFLEDDFIFRGKMKPHSLRGTEGSLVTEELEQEQGDVYLPKRRFSAFFKTDLDQTLRNWKVDTVLVCGISTHFCVLTTALDALCLDFQAVMVEDATAASHPELHEKTLDLYRKNPLFPLLRVQTAEEIYSLQV
jgi:nicotinamidase/pyrazinamidase